MRSGVLKKASVISILLILVLAGSVSAAPRVVLNGSELPFDVPPTIEEGRTLVPLRAIFEALGAEVLWNRDNQTVTARKETTEITLVIGGRATKNGKVVNLDVPAKIVDGRTMVPLRFVSEALGCKVGWDGESQTISISTATEDIRVHCIDVGQAQSIYIQMPGQNDILIDAGTRGDSSTVLNYLRDQGVDDIELLVVTSTREEHFGGVPSVLEYYKVERVIDNGFQDDTLFYQDYRQKISSKGIKWEADNHQTMNFGGVRFEVLTGTGKPTSVDHSVVCRLDTVGSMDFLFMADAAEADEAALSSDLRAKFLLVGNHGASGSSSRGFLDRVKPEVALVSVGAGNKNGWPAVEVIARLLQTGAQVYRTDQNGTIVISTDGSSYTLNKSR
ncbi:MAG: hypothetical protein HPY50_05225 [Firmicutes bacterium]|nr:hypothetical protein [Bacillota bacterium]